MIELLLMYRINVNQFIFLGMPYWPVKMTSQPESLSTRMITFIRHCVLTGCYFKPSMSLSCIQQLNLFNLLLEFGIPKTWPTIALSTWMSFGSFEQMFFLASSWESKGTDRTRHYFINCHNIFICTNFWHVVSQKCKSWCANKIYKSGISIIIIGTNIKKLRLGKVVNRHNNKLFFDY